MLAPCKTCMEVNWAAMLCIVALSSWMPETVLICAIWLVIWALSIGFMGSWLLSCATNNFMNRSVCSWALTVPLDVALVPESAVLLLTAVAMVSVLEFIDPSAAF